MHEQETLKRSQVLNDQLEEVQAMVWQRRRVRLGSALRKACDVGERSLVDV
jgi:hypothetical protein